MVGWTLLSSSYNSSCGDGEVARWGLWVGPCEPAGGDGVHGGKGRAVAGTAEDSIEGEVATLGEEDGEVACDWRRIR